MKKVDGVIHEQRYQRTRWPNTPGIMARLFAPTTNHVDDDECDTD